ncbi:MAG: DUF362 domain-containing protein [Candidatus Omnitrophota bacterium]
MSERSIFEKLFAKKISRKTFIKLCLAGAGSLVTGGIFTKKIFGEEFSIGRAAKNIPVKHDLVAANGEDPYLMTVKAIEAIGGMDRFVKKNSIVLIKPNMAWDRNPEHAGNTNSMVVAALVELSFNAGAKRVNVFDRSCNDARRCHENSGISKAAKEKGANVYFVDEWNYINAHFSYPSPMEGWPIYRDALECDTFINCPVLKHHGLTGLTISMKNLMGVCGGDRGLIHDNIGLKLVHLTDFIKPDLTVVDAYRVLMRNGPSGGNIEDVEEYKTVMVGVDSTLCDAYASELIGKDPLSISNIREAKNHGFGNYDTAKADILKITV